MVGKIDETPLRLELRKARADLRTERERHAKHEAALDVVINAFNETFGELQEVLDAGRALQLGHPEPCPGGEPSTCTCGLARLRAALARVPDRKDARSR